MYTTGSKIGINKVHTLSVLDNNSGWSIRAAVVLFATDNSVQLDTRAVTLKMSFNMGCTLFMRDPDNRVPIKTKTVINFEGRLE